jgi:hypothetical protein
MKRRELLKSGVAGAAISVFRPKQETKQLSCEQPEVQKVETTLKGLDFYVRILDKDMKPVTEAQSFQWFITHNGLVNKQMVQFKVCTKRTDFSYFAIFTLDGYLWHYGPLTVRRTGLAGDTGQFSIGSLELNLELRRTGHENLELGPVDTPSRLGNNERRDNLRLPAGSGT